MNFSITRFFAFLALCVPLIHASSSLATTDHDDGSGRNDKKDDASFQFRRISKKREKRDHIISLVPRLLIGTLNAVDRAHNNRKLQGTGKKGIYKFIDNFSNHRRKLTNNINNVLKKHLLKSSISTKNAVIRGKTLLQGRRDQRDLALSDVIDAYQDTATAAADLFEDFVAEDGFSFDEFETPPVFCSEYSIAGSEDCTQALRALGSLVRTVLMNPPVLYDMGYFVMYNMFMLPWEHILDWEKLRVYLNSIPKDDLYAAIVTEIDSILSDMSENYEDYIPDVYRGIYTELFEDVLGLSSPINFNEMVHSIITDIDPSLTEYSHEIDEVIDEVHSEICYILSLEAVHMDFTSDCDGEYDLLKVPFCVSEEFKAEHNDNAFFGGNGTTWSEGYWNEELGYYVSGQDVSCSLTGKFSYVYEDVITAGHETPRDKFLFKIRPNGALLLKPCKFLAKRDDVTRSQLCDGEIETNGFAFGGEISMAAEACPSICCLIPEDPDNTWVKKKESIEDFVVKPAVVKTCDVLKGLSDAAIERSCKKNFFSDYANSAYIACPETCGLCPN